MNIMQMNQRQMRRYLARSVGGTALSGRRIARPVSQETVKMVLRTKLERTRHTAIVKTLNGSAS